MNASADPCSARVPTAQEVRAGRSLARELKERYAVRGILLTAAQAGYITELRCGMRYCFALDPGEFDRHGPWAPTHEHFPLAKRLGGKREVTNAVLAHRRCNNVGHKIEELQQVLEHLRLEDHTPVRTEAIDAAIADHVKQRRAAEGRYPRKRGSRKRGETIARETHQNLERSAQGEAA